MVVLMLLTEEPVHGLLVQPAPPFCRAPSTASRTDL